MSIPEMLIVQVLLLGSYLVLPWWAVYGWRHGSHGATRALLIGVVVQAVFGTIWNRVGGVDVRLAAGVYYGGFVLFGIVRSWHFRSIGGTRSGARDSLPETLFLLSILLAAAWVRLIHPLQVSALGQSDAYSHLAMFREVVQLGAVAQVAYPPGYAWIMAMPASLVELDVYHVARFGGVFWSVGLMLGCLFLLKQMGMSRRERHLVLFAIALFPAWALIQKTGIGAFPNQAGVMLIPLFLAFVIKVFSKNRHANWCWVVFSSIGFVLLVPMMFLHMLLILGLYGLPFWVQKLREHRVWGLVFVGSMIGLASGGLLLATRLQSRALAVHASVLTTADETAAITVAESLTSIADVIVALVRDYCSIKRIGLGTPLYDLAFVVLGIGFAVFAFVGVRQPRKGYVLCALWGGVTLLQTATGVFQFTAYQREGWSLLLASAVMLSWVGALLWNKIPKFDYVAYPAMAVIAAVVIIWLPPSHVFSSSTAENELVDIARMLAKADSGKPMDTLSSPDIQPLVDLLSEQWNREKPLLVVTRPLLQERLMPAVAGAVQEIRFSNRDIWIDTEEKLQVDNQVLVLLDEKPLASRSVPSAFAMVSPESARQFAAQQNRSYAFNDVLRDAAMQLHARGWDVEQIHISKRLDGVWLVKGTLEGNE